MKFSIETAARVYAAGRNYINLGLGFATSAGVISIAQDKSLTDSFNEIYQGVSLIVHGASSIGQVAIVIGGPIVGGVLAWYAQRSAKATSSAATIGGDPATVVVPGPNGTATVTLPPQLAAPALDAQKKAA
jgi:predicted TIM-barrel enzyme